MSDPTLQTFCCHSANLSKTAKLIEEEFNPDIYNTICIISSTLGILGAIYQILPRSEYRYSHRWLSTTATRGRKIIIWLAVADLLASGGVLVRSTLWSLFDNTMPTGDETTSVLFCAISSGWTQYFYMATWIWTVCYAIDMRLVLKDKPGHNHVYHMCAWIIPLALTSVGLALLYYPNADCHGYRSFSETFIRIFPNYVVTYVPITAILIANPILYTFSSTDLEAVVTQSGQFTNKERDLISAIKLKFSLINLAFYVCWIPNLVNGVLIWVLWYHLPVNVLVITWYVMAATNPLQALFNCLVYRRWCTGTEKIDWPWRKVTALYNSYESHRKNCDVIGVKAALVSTSTPVAPSETDPLIGSRNSINNFCSI